MSKKIVTREQLSEGYIEFRDGVIVKRRFTGVDKMQNGTYAVDWPPATDGEAPTLPDRIPVIDARSGTYYA